VAAAAPPLLPGLVVVVVVVVGFAIAIAIAIARDYLAVGGAAVGAFVEKPLALQSTTLEEERDDYDEVALVVVVVVVVAAVEAVAEPPSSYHHSRRASISARVQSLQSPSVNAAYSFANGCCSFGKRTTKTAAKRWKA